MERLIEKRESGAWLKKGWTYETIAECLDRLAAIEDILGDEYDLDELSETIQAKREGRCVVFPAGIGDVEVRHGRWERNNPDDIVVYCSQCMMPQDAPSNYCPSCGALMDKEDEHEVG